MWSQHCSLVMEFNASAELSPFSPYGHMMDEVHMHRSSLWKCLDFNETKKIFFVFGVGVISTGLNLSLSISNSCCDKMRQGFPSSGSCSSQLVSPHPILRPAPHNPHSQSQLENDCHTHTRTHTHSWQFKETNNKILLTGLSRLPGPHCGLAHTGFAEHIWPLNVWPNP